MNTFLNTVTFFVTGFFGFLTFLERIVPYFIFFDKYRRWSMAAKVLEVVDGCKSIEDGRWLQKYRRWSVAAKVLLRVLSKSVVLHFKKCCFPLLNSLAKTSIIKKTKETHCIACTMKNCIKLWEKGLYDDSTLFLFCQCRRITCGKRHHCIQLYVFYTHHEALFSWNRAVIMVFEALNLANFIQQCTLLQKRNRNQPSCT